MNWKTYSVSWDEWVRFCAEHGEDPYEIADLSFETNGGDGYTVVYQDDPPEREEDAEIKD